MPHLDPSIPRSRLVLAVLAGLILSAALAAWINRVATLTADQVTHSLAVKETAQQVLNLAVDAETGQRGFLLTHDSQFLAPYEEASRTMDGKLGQLAQLVADKPEQFDRVGRLRDLIAGKFDELGRTIALVQSGDAGTALAIVQGGDGKHVMNQVRDLFAAILEEQERRLAGRQDTLARQRLWSGAALACTLLGLGGLALAESRRSRRQAAALSRTNAELDALVRERTVALEREQLRVEALLRDVSHRIGNSLSTVSALLAIQSRQSSEPAVRQALADATARIHAIAASQRRLQLDLDTDRVDAKPYVDNLVAELEGDAARHGIRIEAAVDSVHLPGRDAVSYVVLINELLTNAIKHAFPDGRGGRVAVRLASVPEGAGHLIRIVVEDDGVGLAAAPARAGIGRTVIARMVKAMQGAFENGPAAPGDDRPGLRVSISIPQQPPTA